MKRRSLVLPLAVGFSGTMLALIMKNKKIHLIFGTIWAVASLLHMYQHRKSLVRETRKGFCSMNLLKAVGIPTSKLDWFLKTITVKSYIPGRIRIYSKALINNPRNKQAVEAALGKYSELDKITINTITGSVLIEYRPDNIKYNQALCEIEQFIKQRAKK